MASSCGREASTPMSSSIAGTSALHSSGMCSLLSCCMPFRAAARASNELGSQLWPPLTSSTCSTPPDTAEPPVYNFWNKTTGFVCGSLTCAAHDVATAYKTRHDLMHSGKRSADEREHNGCRSVRRLANTCCTLQLPKARQTVRATEYTGPASDLKRCEWRQCIHHRSRQHQLRVTTSELQGGEGCCLRKLGDKLRHEHITPLLPFCNSWAVESEGPKLWCQHSSKVSCQFLHQGYHCSNTAHSGCSTVFRAEGCKHTLHVSNRAVQGKIWMRSR